MARMGIAELVGSAQALAAAGQAAAGRGAVSRLGGAEPRRPGAARGAVQPRRAAGRAGRPTHGAVEAFSAAIRREPDFLPPYINLGAAYERLGAGGAGLRALVACLDQPRRR